jgi:hypothetical protein
VERKKGDKSQKWNEMSFLYRNFQLNHSSFHLIFQGCTIIVLRSLLLEFLLKVRLLIASTENIKQKRDFIQTVNNH